MSFSNDRHVEYTAWKEMRRRCLSPENKDFANYGGRGIRICDRWVESFENFYSDMGPRPSESHSLDRRDNNGHYEPSNCRWATPFEQANNRRTNVFVELNGQPVTVSEFARHHALDPEIVRGRLNRGNEPERVIQTGRLPRDHADYFEYDGKRLTVHQWCAETGMSYMTLYNRLYRSKLPIGEALTRPVVRKTGK